MKIVIRVDASIYIGTGHVMRCLTLAEDLHRRRCCVEFICRIHPGHLEDMIIKKGFPLSLLPEPEQTLEVEPDKEDYAVWLGVTQGEDAQQTIEALGCDSPDWLIVDHYGLDAYWEKTLRPYVGKIMVIDDLANRKHDCDLFLDQNYFQAPEKRYQGLLPEHCEILLRPKYALLRSEFRQAKEFTHMRGNGIARVLVYFGGSDSENLTGMALEALASSDFRHLFVDVVVGPNNQHLEQLERQCENRPGARFHIQPEGFVELMLRADFCIGAGGTTTWERLSLGLPSMVITVSKNQDAFIEELSKAGYVKWIGKKESVTCSDIHKCLITEIYKLTNEAVFSSLPNPVDGFGALRVVEMLMPSTKQELSMRRADNEDAGLFYFWANDPVVRRNSFQQEPIDWQDHKAWFNDKLYSSQTVMWVLQTQQGLPVGQTRFDIGERVANISYSLDPLVRGRNWGEKLVELGINKMRELDKQIMIQGKTKKSNKASRKIFFKLGFMETVENEVSIFKK